MQLQPKFKELVSVYKQIVKIKKLWNYVDNYIVSNYTLG